jgi:hypothetical protein
MRRQGSKLLAATATATERLRAIADLRSADSGRGGRCELCWWSGSSSASSRTLSDPCLSSSPVPWQEVHHDAEFHSSTRIDPFALMRRSGLPSAPGARGERDPVERHRPPLAQASAIPHPPAGNDQQQAHQQGQHREGGHPWHADHRETTHITTARIARATKTRPSRMMPPARRSAMALAAWCRVPASNSA